MTSPTSAARLRRLVPAALFAVAIALGAPAMANAEPNTGQGPDREWDIEAYDNCMNKTIRNADLCCYESGGDFGPSQDGDEAGSGHCQAPPAQSAGQQNARGPRRLPTDITITTVPGIS